MTIENIRLGHATNSSSTHFIIFFDEKGDDFSSYEEYHDSHFGWSNFTLTTEDKKRSYFSYLLYEQLERSGLSEKIAKKITYEVCKVEEIGDGVDHQSTFQFPYDWGTTQVNTQFAREYIDFLSKNPRVFILGGNDNTSEEDEDHPYRNRTSSELTDIAGPVLSKDMNFPFPLESYDCKIYAKKESNGTWLIYNALTGGKVRFNFTGKPTSQQQKPSLLDIFITWNCDLKCSYCYTDSKSTDPHASMENIQALAEALGKEQMPEIALGGGDPLTHPNFMEILNTFRKNVMIVNFTTRKTDWLTDPKLVSEILNGNTHVAFSIDSATHLNKILGQIIKAEGILNRKIKEVKFQIVPAAMSKAEFSEIMKVIRSNYLSNRTLLLGFKSTGRGEQFKPFDYDWIEVLKDNKIYGIGVDTSLAKQNKERFEELEIHPSLYETEEGLQSAFIDAVNMEIAKSSYNRSNKRHYDVRESLEHNFQQLNSTFEV